MEYLSHLIRISYTVIGPIVVLVGAGYLVGRRVPAAAEVLAKILLYLLIPVYVFLNVLDSSLGRETCVQAVVFSVVIFALLYAAARAVAAQRRFDPPLRGAFINTAILYNSANFAIPVMDLAFGFDETQRTFAVAAQVVVGAVQGLGAYTIGAFIAAAGSGNVGHAAAKVFRLPFIYALILVLILKGLGLRSEHLQQVTILWKPATIIGGAYVPIALMTLGAQMATVRLVRAPVDLTLSTVLRLAVGPVLALGLVKAMGIEGILAQVLVIGASGPTAVASAVVAIEFRNRPDFAASAVFLSTLGAGVTVPVIIFLVQSFL